MAVGRLDDLPPSGLDSAEGMPPWRAREHLAGRALLRGLLRRHTGRGDDAIAVEPSGRPHLPDRPEVGISVSHSSGLVAAAIGLGCPVGVDVERPAPVDRAVLRRCCAPDAVAVLDRLPADRRAREFTRIWTVQEACVKALGLGLAGRPWTVPVAPGQHRGRWRGLRWVSWPDRWAAPVSCAFGPPAEEGMRR
ncbi:hypothetical protein GCM10010185_60570 [Saccharothrix coeruleofusca]|uniref:4'-phosphopantetheinyl transferase n=1 Tax=Saccharothrix coeruleofusca TaxID=33919 RepID=A0A918AW23_9PSEU|nr:hypothetical protein GCM10010185_60570 [Saccharothrix coeruleofusca]